MNFVCDVNRQSQFRPASRHDAGRVARRLGHHHVLAAATIPRLRPEMDRSRVREAARSIQLYLSSARNQAMATGRVLRRADRAAPGGERLFDVAHAGGNAVRYGGDIANSTATVTQSQPPKPTRYAYCNITLSPAPSVPLYPGDQIQIGYQGFWITLRLRTQRGCRHRRDHQPCEPDRLCGHQPRRDSRLDRSADYRTLQRHPLADEVGGLAPCSFPRPRAST